jgi:hypothetical protein
MYYTDIQSPSIIDRYSFKNNSNTNEIIISFLSNLFNDNVIKANNHDIFSIIDRDYYDFSSFNTMLASEPSLSKDWLLQEEDDAWKDL